MSAYEPQVGDEVEVVLRGRVGLSDEGVFDIGDGPWINSIVPSAPHVVSVTKVEPPYVRPAEPAGLGAVIESGGSRFIRVRPRFFPWWPAYGYLTGHRFTDLRDPIVVLSEGYHPQDES